MSCTIDMLLYLSVYVMSYWQYYYVSVCHVVLTVLLCLSMSCRIDSITMSQYVMSYWQYYYVSVCLALLFINVKVCNQLSVCNVFPTISLEMPVPSQGHWGFPSFLVVDWFCLFVDLWVLPFPLEDCSVFDNFVITLIQWLNPKSTILIVKHTLTNGGLNQMLRRQPSRFHYG
jgi:hypothetical protein